MKKAFTKNGRIIFTIAILAFAAILLAFIFLGGSVNARFDSESLTLSATLTSKEKILFNEIENVELKENITVGSRSWGIGGGKLSAGNFKNREYGNYKLFSYSNLNMYIVIKTSKRYFVYNLKNKSLTQKSYNDLLNNLAGMKQPTIYE